MATSTTSSNTPTVQNIIDTIVGATRVGLDLETTGLDPREAELRLVQIAADERTLVIDTRSGIALRGIFKALRNREVITHGGDFEYRFVYHNYGVMLNNLRDTMLASQLLAFGHLRRISSSLGAVSEMLLDTVLDKKMQEPTEWGADVLDDRRLKYAAKDAQILLPLYEILTEAIKREGLMRVYEVECACLPSVALMAYQGMPVNKAAWDAHADKVNAALQQLEEDIMEADWMPQPPPVPQQWKLQGPDCVAMLQAAGLDVDGSDTLSLADHMDEEIVKRLMAYRQIRKDPERKENAKAAVLELAPDKEPLPPEPWNLDSSQQIKEICRRLLGFEPKSTNETNMLKWRARKKANPFFDHLLQYRKLYTNASRYGHTWFAGSYREDTGRVYPNFWQIGTSTGRFASTKPNAQNIPHSHRKFFVAPPGRTFADVDASQIEIRILAKLERVERLVQLLEAGDDIYKNTAADMLSIDKDDVSPEQRQLAKAIMLGLNYGLSAVGLPEYAFKNYGIKITPAQAERRVKDFYNLYPEIKRYHDWVASHLRGEGAPGYIDQKTLTGRRRDGITNRNEAINAPVQGLAADVIKLAMAYVYRKLMKFGGTAFIVNTIHDELLVECNEANGQEVLKVVEEEMLRAMEELINGPGGRTVPLKVEGTVTKVWTKG